MLWVVDGIWVLVVAMLPGKRDVRTDANFEPVQVLMQILFLNSKVHTSWKGLVKIGAEKNVLSLAFSNEGWCFYHRDFACKLTTVEGYIEQWWTLFTWKGNPLQKDQNDNDAGGFRDDNAQYQYDNAQGFASTICLSSNDALSLSY